MLNFTAGSFGGRGWKLHKVKESCERVMVFAFFIAWRYTVITVLQRCATYLQPSGSDTPTGSERISRLPFFPFNPSQKIFLEHPRTLRLSTCVCQGGAREARDDRFFGEKKNFLGGHFHGTPQFLKPQILAETLYFVKKKCFFFPQRPPDFAVKFAGVW